MVENAQGLLDKAVRDLQSGDRTGTRRYLSELTRQEHANADLYYNCGVVSQAIEEQGYAELFYRKALGLNAGDVFALNNLGNVLRQTGRCEEALRCFDRVLELTPQEASAWHNRGLALFDLGRYEQALRAQEQALASRAEYAEAHLNRALVLQKLERYEDALGSVERAIELKPEEVEGHFNRGLLLGILERHEEALGSFERALALKPGYAQAHSNRGVALERLGRYEEALASHDKALSLEPDLAEAHYNRGVALGMLKRDEESLTSYDRAVALKPEYAEVYLNRGAKLERLGRHEEALMDHDKALALKPKSAEAWYNRSVSLHSLIRNEEAVASVERALELKPDYVVAHSNKIFISDFMPGQGFAEQQAERRRFDRAHAIALMPAVAPRSRGFELPLRLGYVSADFRNHSASNVFGGILRQHDRSRFKLVLYSSGKVQDEVTRRYRELADEWVEAAGLSDEALAARIRADRIDILIDLSGHTEGNRLLVFARKPAPVQVTAWGYATGTGLSSMDYLFADPVSVPAEVRKWFAETVYDLPCFCPYEAPKYIPQVERLPAEGRGWVSFGCLNRFSKVSGQAMRLWARVLKTVSGARLLLKDSALENAQLRNEVLDRFAGYGVERERIELRGASSNAEHLATYNEVDIALDPFPQGGGVSTWEALMMGVPVVSKLGNSVHGRSCGAIMTAVGFGEWVAQDDAGYERIAVEKAANPEALARFRRESRGRIAASAVGDLQRYTRAVEEAYISMARQ